MEKTFSPIICREDTGRVNFSYSLYINLESTLVKNICVFLIPARQGLCYRCFRINWIAFCVVLLSNQPVVAQIVVSAYKINNIFDPAGTGKYDALIEKVQPDSQLITIEYQSIINARRSFRSKKLTALLLQISWLSILAFR